MQSKKQLIFKSDYANNVYLIAVKIFKTNDSRNEHRYIHHETLKLNLQQHILYGLLFIVSGAVSGALSK